jgi:copper chaperone CopZ
LATLFATTLTGAEPGESKDRQTTKATYLVTGLHCPPCTKTVERSLQGIKGVQAVKVDWQTKNARIEFDENLIPAQTLAQRIAGTAHMMGGGMRYDGWLALQVPDVKDEAKAKQVKEVLGKLKGVKQAVAYPAQQSVGVQFTSDGKLTSQQLIDALDEAGFKAKNR